MRLPLATLEVFDAIARAGSLRGAADRLGVQPSTVSHQLKALETQLGTALFIRTTRSLALTEAGRALSRGAGPAFDQLADALASARDSGHAARGTLRLAMPEFVYHLLIGPALGGFRAAYPEIALELSLTDGLSDILDEGLHAGFRLGDRIAQDMVALRLTAPLRLTVCASPGYLARQGTPQRPRDLLDHECIRYRFLSSGRIAPWEFTAEGRALSVDVRGGLIVNTLPVSVDLARRDLGVISIFRDYVGADLACGTLVPVLEAYVPVLPGVFIYFPREYRAMVPLRLFVDHLRAGGGAVRGGG